MKRSIVILALCGVLFNAAKAQRNNDKLLSTAFNKVLEEQFKTKETGVTALVSKNGKVIYKRALGMANLELNVPMQFNNVFRIGSVTKQFTAVAILQLMEKGKLNLQDEITRFIPNYPTQGNTITIEHLLSHTSGIRDFTSIKDNEKRSAIDYTPKEMIDYFKGQPMRFAPGTKWEYSNSNYFILGYIIERITGKTYGQYLEENFFKPLHMNNSFYTGNSTVIRNKASGYTRGNKELENARYISMTQPYAAGSILSTAEDLFKWNQAVQSHKLLKKETLDKALTRYKLNDGAETNYGYGWRLGYIQESSSIWHGGLIDGFMSMAMYLPKEDVFVTVLSNCDCKSPVDVTEKIAALAIGKSYDHKAIPVDSVILAGYSGVYENEKEQQRIISMSGNQLNLQLGRGPKAVIKAFQKDKFFTDDPMLTLEFSRNKSNKVDKLIIHSRTANEVWIKTNKPAASEDGIKVDEKILESYVGEYEINPDFVFSITKEKGRLFLKATGQEKVEIFAEAENKFFLKVNGAQLEFVKDNSGKVIKAILIQGSRQTDAKKIK
ncbi:MAG: serine hydrolase [Segetibacter sp.]|nr:serine hydrolase [Segetibacter sp.]